jgi:hypothetical protein
LKERRAAAAALRQANEVVITALGEPLNKVDLFDYLGRPLASDNGDWPAVFKNLKKAKKKWAWLSRPLVRAGADPKTVGQFYKAVVQAVLLYGSESWVVTPAMLRVLSSFHHKAGRRIAGKMAKLVDGKWVYPPLKDALEEAKLLSIGEYIQVRQNTVAEYIATRPIMGLCTAASERAESSSRHLRWWTQPLRQQQQEPPLDMVVE